MLLLEVGKCRCRSGCREGDSIDQNLEGDRKEKREERREKKCLVINILLRDLISTSSFFCLIWKNATFLRYRY
jgi:hypothetical protein